MFAQGFRRTLRISKKIGITDCVFELDEAVFALGNECRVIHEVRGRKLKTEISKLKTIISISQPRSEPAFDFFDAYAFALGIVFDLVALEIAERKIVAIGMG